MLRLAVLLMFITQLAWAQEARLPAFQSVYVNDYAEVLSAQAEAELAKRLSAVKAENGTEMSVLTINSRDTYGFHSSFESFARDIFNDWGIGDAAKNNGALLLVAVEDREARIELGRGYGSAMDEVAAEILDEHILPEMAGRNFETGILNGTEAMITRLVGGSSGGTQGWLTRDNIIAGGMAALFLAVIGSKILSNRRKRRCPSCGSNNIETLASSIAGRERKCLQCGHAFILAASTRDNRNDDHDHHGGDGFGGGSSDGGGASGRW